MKRRLYYVADDLGSLAGAVRALEREGIVGALRVVSNDLGELERHRLHASMLRSRRDGAIVAVHFALAGLLVGILIAAACRALGTPLPAGAEPIVVALFAAAGAVSGRMLAQSRDARRLASFRTAVDAGSHVLMIDVPKGRKWLVRELISLDFPDLRFAGHASTTVNPFDQTAAFRFKHP